MKINNQIKIIDFLWSESVDKFLLFLDMIPLIKNL